METKFKPINTISGTDGLLNSECGRIDCHLYPFIQVTPHRFCSMANTLLKKALGRYCAGLTELERWRLRSDEETSEFLQDLYCSRMSRYAGIGRKYAAFLDNLVSNNSSVIDPDSPFILEKITAGTTAGDGSRQSPRYWLLAVDTRCDVGYSIAKEEWYYPALTYNSRLNIETVRGVHTVRFMVDDIMTNRFLVPNPMTVKERR